MKAVIDCSVPEGAWTSDFFDGFNPYMLPLAAKPLLEYYLDYCALCSIKDVLILYDDDYRDDIAHFVSLSAKWGLEISSAPRPHETGENSILKHHANFVGGERVLLISGFFFPNYFKDDLTADAPSNCGLRIRTVGAKSAEQRKFCRCEEIELALIEDYFSLNMRLMGAAKPNVIMKGYSAQSNVYMGMNDVVQHGAMLTPPIVLGDNTQIAADAKIGPNTIIGDTCMVDRRTRIESCVIFDQTYIGADLDLRNKIICGSDIIDPSTHVKVGFSDNFFSSRMDDKFAFRIARKTIAALAALPLIIVMALPFLLLSFFTKLKRHNAAIGRSGRKIIFAPVYKPRKGTANVWFFKFSLDKFVPLTLVIAGKMNLIGDTPRDIKRDASIIKRYKNYEPGVFTYADSLGHYDPFESLMDDLYYKHNRTLRGDLQLMLRSLVGRLLEGEKNDEL